MVEARIACFTRDFNRAKRAYRRGDHNAAALLLYDLIKDLNQIRSLVLDEYFLESRQRADALAAPSAPTKPGEAH
jgi:hypothetical protein